MIISAIQFAGCSREPRILLYVRDGSSDFEYMLTQEIEVMKSMLDEAGLRVVVATLSEESYYHLRADLKPDIALKDVKVSKYAFGYTRFPEGIYGGTGVVQDGQVITSGTCPYQARLTGRPDGTREREA